MFVFRKMSLVVKLALVAGFRWRLMAGMIFAILESRRKGAEGAELQARTALRVFEISWPMQQRHDRFRRPRCNGHTATLWDGAPFELPQDARPDQRCHGRAADLLHLTSRNR
jgi:hypothetical protein